MIVNTAKILGEQKAVLAVNVVTLEHAQAFVTASEKTGIGLVMQISQNAVRYQGSLAPIGKAMLELADKAKTQISVHLDHATDRDLVKQAMELGFSSVMFDGSQLEVTENISQTKSVVAQASELGIWVEAEIGEIGGKDGVHAPGVKTSVADAFRFQNETGVHGLAIAVGSSHAMIEKDASLDLVRIVEIAEAVDVPLVLHGSSGVPEEQLVAAVAAGIRKINLSTELNKRFTQSIRHTLEKDAALVDPRKYLSPAREQLSDLVSHYLKLLS